MFSLRRATKKKPGWLAIHFQNEGVSVAHVLPATGKKPVVSFCAVRPPSFAVDSASLEKLAKELQVDQYHCTTLLRFDEYQMLQVEAPNVPPEELKIAIRWRIKDLLDYHVDDATLDVLDIPPDRNAPTKTHSMYAIAAPNRVIGQRQALFEEARIPLSVIDIPEMAQRNIAALLEPEQRGLALLSFGGDGGLLTISYAGELYLSRRIDISLEQLADTGEVQRTANFDRITLEMQRTLDHFDRQFHFITLAKLLLAPLPNGEGLREYLAANLYLPVESLNMADVLDISAVPELERTEYQSLCFAALGAALRHEGKLL